ncbi:protein NRT1/ PTR FAMILY 7.2 isoform X2 [Cryptomeria japonica]|nr:protein NRT1/ PTR FAMILY 7.2 isoform X2 [Cryptomeria japonica]XP_057870103.2 protein NRT1/ PTR FAMILY 7.2 isoform X2 [Cryptomeria japonica]
MNSRTSEVYNKIMKMDAQHNSSNSIDQFGKHVDVVCTKDQGFGSKKNGEILSEHVDVEEKRKAQHTEDGSVDRFGKPAIKGKTGGWKAAILILVNQGLATLAFFGVGVNMVLFFTRVLQQNNAEAANNVSKWTGTVYMFSLVGAFLSDAYLGRHMTCVLFLVIFVLGIAMLALSAHFFLINPPGCGKVGFNCQHTLPWENGIFYLSIYMVALGSGGYQPSIATFGADQFDEEDTIESASKVSFFSWFYLALNLGSLISNTVLDYLEDNGMWALGFWVSCGAAALSLLIYLWGTPFYRHHRPRGNPLTRFAQVFVAATRNCNVEVAYSKLYELPKKEFGLQGRRMILHSDGFRWLDKAAAMEEPEYSPNLNNKTQEDPWHLCTVTQVEEVKCILRMLPIWLCTIIYSVVFTQMTSLFVEQGTTMNTHLGRFRIPPASMSVFDILSVVTWVMLYRRVLSPFASLITGNPKGLTELQRMGVGLIIGMTAMLAAGLVELERLKRIEKGAGFKPLGILWQVPQYVLIGASEVFMYVGQLEFFNAQAPDGLKSFGSALCMTSISLGNYVSSLLVTIVMDITKRENSPGWIPRNLNRGHMDRFYFLLALLTTIDFGVYVICAKWYRCISLYRNPTIEDLDQELM